MAGTLTPVCFLCFIMIFFKQNSIKFGLILINFFGFTGQVMAMNPFPSKKPPSIGTYPMGVNPFWQSQPSSFLLKKVKQESSPLEYDYIWNQRKIIRCLSSYPYTNVIEYLANTFGSNAEFWHLTPSETLDEYDVLQELCPDLLDQTRDSQNLLPKFSYNVSTLVYNPGTNVDPKHACVQSILSKSDRDQFLKDMKKTDTLLASLTQKKRISQQAVEDTKAFATINKNGRIIFEFSDTHGHYGIYNLLATIVCFAHEINPNISVVISGDLAQRIYKDRSNTEIHAPDKTKLNSTKLIKFLKNLNDTTKGHLYIGLGNHDIQDLEQFRFFLDEMDKLKIPVLSNLKNGFNQQFSEKLQDYIIDEDTVYFPLCFNFSNSGWDWKLSEALLANHPIQEDTVLTSEYMKSLLDLVGDCKSRDGCINSLENPPGKLNIAAAETAEKFYAALQQAVQNNPGDAPIYFVILAHEHPQRVLAFFETISYFMNFPEEWLRRIVFVFAGGHEHKPYMLQKPCFMKAADTGNLISIRSTMGGPSMYGLYFCLFALRPELHKCEVIPQMTLCDNQARILTNYETLNHPIIMPFEWQKLLKIINDQKVFSSSWFFHNISKASSGNIPKVKPSAQLIQHIQADDYTDSDEEEPDSEQNSDKQFLSSKSLKKADSNFDWRKFQKEEASKL